MRLFATALIFCGAIAAHAQAPVVPHKMSFAGMTLTIRDDARREIQKDVDALTQSPKYFMIKVERARTYFPIIEKIFAEERVPDDFKFLCIQESALIADAVSVSDAVGFWQFKDFTAREMGLRVDDVIDERMNIASSSRGAARYIKQNNFLFNNWVYALQAYQMGAGGVKRLVGDDHDGSRHMEITSDTYWYVKKFLAHKVAFEEAVKAEPSMKVSPLAIANGSHLKDIAAQTSTDLAQLQEYNKWARKATIPSDKEYLVFIPTGSAVQDFTKLVINQPKTEVLAEVKEPQAVAKAELPTHFINDVPTIKALPGETLSMLATRAGVEVTQLARYNEVPIDHKVMAGAPYFLDKKKARAAEDYHHVAEGEDLWRISQLYGVQVKRLKKYNKLSETGKLPKGSVVWLSSGKPQGEIFSDETEAVLEVEPAESFEWSTVEPQEDSDGLDGIHVVKAGETLYSIAKAHNIAVKELQELNQLEAGQGLRVGETLKLVVNEPVTSESEPSPADDRVHEVQPSDTLYSVARQYGVTIKELMDLNDKKELSLAVGEKLRIPSR